MYAPSNLPPPSNANPLNPPLAERRPASEHIDAPDDTPFGSLLSALIAAPPAAPAVGSTTTPRNPPEESPSDDTTELETVAFLNVTVTPPLVIVPTSPLGVGGQVDTADSLTMLGNEPTTTAAALTGVPSQYAGVLTSGQIPTETNVDSLAGVTQTSKTDALTVTLEPLPTVPSESSTTESPLPSRETEHSAAESTPDSAQATGPTPIAETTERSTGTSTGSEHQVDRPSRPTASDAPMTYLPETAFERSLREMTRSIRASSPTAYPVATPLTEAPITAINPSLLNVASLETPLLPRESHAPTPLAHVPAAVLSVTQDLASGASQQVFIRLDPPELGKVLVRIRRDRDTVSIEMTTDSSEVSKSLQSQEKLLVDRLVDSGFGKADIELSYQEQHSASADAHSDKSTHGSRPKSNRIVSRQRLTASPPATTDNLSFVA